MFYNTLSNNNNKDLQVDGKNGVLIKNFIDFSNNNNNNNNNKIELYKNQDYETLKRECLSTRKLFEDPLFPINDKSISYTKSIPAGVTWKRPSEIIRWPLSPIFICNNGYSLDLDHGILGDNWFTTACSIIPSTPHLFSKIVPKDQLCNGRFYAGIFHFRFWLYGIWYDVVIDDRLPVDSNNKLLFCINKNQPNEFWTCLLEKAYAKILMSYENLEGGLTKDALVDMTGGVHESFCLLKMLTDKHKEIMWDILKKGRILKSLMSTSISADTRLNNGLIAGKFFGITRVALLELNNKNIRLVRLQSPSGFTVEWKGAWSDDSEDWKELTNELREALEYKELPDGEFWMSYDDFYNNFHNIEFFNMIPDTHSPELNQTQKEKLEWNVLSYHGEWLPGSTAGGCGQYNEALYWTNPQLLITIKEHDSNDDDKLANVIVSLMQKNLKENKLNKFNKTSYEHIQFRFYRVKNDQNAESAKKSGLRFYADELERYGTSGEYTNTREVSKRYRVEPGNYLIIPSCYQANKNPEFLLRIFTEKPIDNLNCKILDGHKDNLNYNDLFYFTKFNEENIDILGVRNNINKEEEKSEATTVKAGMLPLFKPVKTPIFETFEKVTFKRQNCILM